MAYFPIYIDMKDLKVLLVGGGKIAAEKLAKLLDFTQAITVISIAVDENVKELVDTHSLSLHIRAYMPRDIQGFDIVIIATDNTELHKAIYQESREANILVNSVDNQTYCDFIFPSYIQKGDLTIAFSTAGASPAFAKRIRQYFENTIPDSVGGFLEKMKDLRSTMPKGRERMIYFETLVERYFSQHFK